MDLPDATPPRAAATRAAAALTALAALVVAAFGVFFVLELVAGQGDAGRVIGGAVLIVLVAAGLFVLSVLWWRGSGSAKTPTVVWNVLLIPVVIALFQSGQGSIATAVGIVVVASLVAALVAPGSAAAHGRDRDGRDEELPGDSTAR